MKYLYPLYHYSNILPCQLAAFATELSCGTQCLDEDEFIDVAAYEVSDLCEKIYAGEIQDAKTVAAVLAYANRIK